MQHSPIPCLGNIGIDVAVTPDGRTAHAAGTALRCTLGAALFGVGLTPIAAVGAEPVFDEPFAQLRRRGADLSALERRTHSITFTTTYDSAGAITHFHIDHAEMMDHTAELATQRDLAGARMAVLCPLPFDALSTLALRARSADIPTFMVLHYAQFAQTAPPDFLPLIANIDYLILNADEARRITQVDDVERAGERLSRACRRAVFLTMAERGAAVFADGNCIARAPTLVTSVRNLLGAGDTFAGGVIAGLALTGRPDVALTYGLLAASLVVAQPNHELLLAAMT
jgi:sugar/nucleoside kinase (ribokinase family)